MFYTSTRSLPFERLPFKITVSKKTTIATTTPQWWLGNVSYRHFKIHAELEHCSFNRQARIDAVFVSAPLVTFLIRFNFWIIDDIVIAYRSLKDHSVLSHRTLLEKEQMRVLGKEKVLPASVQLSVVLYVHNHSCLSCIFFLLILTPLFLSFQGQQRWKGCGCGRKGKSRACDSDKCPCFKSRRECDPELCRNCRHTGYVTYHHTSPRSLALLNWYRVRFARRKSLIFKIKSWLLTDCPATTITSKHKNKL